MTSFSCPFCGHPVSEGAAVCPYCSRPLNDAPPVAPAVPSDENPAPASQPDFPRPEGASVPPQPDAPPPGPGAPRSGTPLSKDAASLIPSQPGPRYAPQTPQEPDGGLSTAQYFWTLFLFAVPVLGLILMIYWSFGSTTCPARQRLARASLIKTGVLGVLAAIALACVFAMAVVFGRGLLYTVEDYLYGPYGGPYGYYSSYSEPGCGGFGSAGL